MKLETPSDLWFIIAVLVPGFIYSSILSQLVPRRLAGTTETIILGYLTGTAFNYAIFGLPIYLILTGRLFAGNIFGQVTVWFLVTFLAPIFLAIVTGLFIQKDWPAKIFGRAGLRWINLIPTGWDWIFSRTSPCFALVTLQDGRVVAGYFGLQSMASSDPTRRDLFLEKVYIVPETGPWVPAVGSAGIYIEAGQIAFIEFKGN